VVSSHYSVSKCRRGTRSGSSPYFKDTFFTSSFLFPPRRVLRHPPLSVRRASFSLTVPLEGFGLSFFALRVGSGGRFPRSKREPFCWPPSGDPGRSFGRRFDPSPVVLDPGFGTISLFSPLFYSHAVRGAIGLFWCFFRSLFF